MSEDSNNKNIGFSGISSLASHVETTEDDVETSAVSSPIELKDDLPQVEQEKHIQVSDPDKSRKEKQSPPPYNSTISSPTGFSGKKWFWCIVGVIALIRAAYRITEKKELQQTTKGLDAFALAGQAAELWKDGKYTNPRKAIVLLDKAIELDPGSADAYIYRGLAYDNLKQYTKAIQDYDRAIGLNSGFAMAHNNRGFAYANLKQYERAIQDYNKAIELDPGSALAYGNRGFAYFMLNKVSRGCADAKEVCELGDCRFWNNVLKEGWCPEDPPITGNGGTLSISEEVTDPGIKRKGFKKDDSFYVSPSGTVDKNKKQEYPPPKVIERSVVADKPVKAEVLKHDDSVIEEKRAAEKQWAEWQKQMEREFAKAEKFERNIKSNAKEKAEAWNIFLLLYGSGDNPYSSKDNVLREKAEKRRTHWKTPLNRRSAPKT